MIGQREYCHPRYMAHHLMTLTNTLALLALSSLPRVSIRSRNPQRKIRLLSAGSILSSSMIAVVLLIFRGTNLNNSSSRTADVTSRSRTTTIRLVPVTLIIKSALVWPTIRRAKETRSTHMKIGQLA